MESVAIKRNIKRKNDMKGYEKLTKIGTILNAWRNKMCPSCNGNLEKYMKHDGWGWCCHTCKMMVEDATYLKNIDYVQRIH